MQLKIISILLILTTFNINIINNVSNNIPSIFLNIKNLILKKKDNNIIIVHTDFIKRENFNNDIWNLNGNIELKHKNYIIKCNKGIYYSNNNKFIGYGNVIIKDINNSNFNFLSSKIEYYGNSRIFKSYGNSIFSDEKKN